MSKETAVKEMKEMLGLVPGFFKPLPDNQFELEWQLFKSIQLDEGPIPQKYRELIGIGISAVTKCQYCAFYHTEAAKLFGATKAEIEQAVHYAKSSAGWSAYINGLQMDYDTFCKEVVAVCDHVRGAMGAAKPSAKPGANAAKR
jgi:AhpD family alkylhydroperoxidase